MIKKLVLNGVDIKKIIDKIDTDLINCIIDEFTLNYLLLIIFK